MGAIVFSLLALSEITDRGHDLRPYESGEVYKVEIADSVVIYADAESRPDSDTISGSVLVALTTASLIALLLLRAAGQSERLQRFYLLAAIGFGLLAFDEFWALHETLGHNLIFLADLPGVERPDDVIFALWVLPALAFAFWFRDVLFASKRLRALFGAGLVAGLLAAIADVLGLVIDDPLEILVAGCLVAGFTSLLVDHLTPIVKRDAGTLATGSRKTPAPMG